MPTLRTFWQKPLTAFSTTTTLTMWRWRQQWPLLLITGLGVLIATALACSLPLFSSVMTTAGLRATLRASSDNARLEVHLNLAALSSESLDGAIRQVSALFTRDLASDVTTAGDLSMQIEVPD